MGPGKDSYPMSKVWRRRDERGAILVMSTVGFVLAIIASALAVDLGRIAQERRRDQKVADLAALDAVRELGSGDAAIQAAAQASATRNELPAGATVTAFEGTLDSSGCVQQAGTGQVCVTISTTIDNQFRPGDRNVIARALAEKQESAGFTIGSSLASASLDTELPILNGVFNELLDTSGTVNLVSWQGIANSTITLRQLQTAMSVGTLDELLTTNITAGQLLSATATALNNQGTVASIDAATKLASLAAAAQNTTQFQLGDYITVAQGYEDKALDGAIDVMQLITAGAQLANKNSFIDAGSVITLPVNFPSLGTSGSFSTKLGLKVIEGPQLYVGPVGGSVDTAQVELTLTPRIDVNFTSPLYNILSLLSAIGTANLRLYGDMPITFKAAGATGTLEEVRCISPNQGITVGVVTRPITTDVEGNLDVYLQTAGLLPANVKVDLSVQPTEVSTTPGGPFDLNFQWASEFTPPDLDGKQTPGAPAGITMTNTDVQASIGAAGLTQVLGLLTGTLKLDVVTSNVVGPILNPIFNAVANRLTTPALKALGLSIGPVDVHALAEFFDPSANCGTPVLVG